MYTNHEETTDNDKIEILIEEKKKRIYKNIFT